MRLRGRLVCHLSKGNLLPSDLLFIPLGTDSQNGWGWRHLWVLLVQPLPKQGHPEWGAQDLVLMGFEDLEWVLKTSEETPQLLCAACVRAPSPAQHRNCDRCSEGASSAPVCAQYLLI